MSHPVALRKENGVVHQLTPADLLDEFLSVSPCRALWDLSNHHITPEFLKMLLTLISESTLDLLKPIAIDLFENQLNSATKEDFISIAGLLNKGPLKHVQILLGYEVFRSYLEQALFEKDMMSMLGTRIYIASPFDKTRTLDSLLQQMVEVNKQTEKRMLAVETADTSRTIELKNLTNYRDTDDVMIEAGCSAAVASQLENAEVIVPSRYVFAGSGGDLDGMVVGKYGDKEVVVLIEAKHNMDSSHRKGKDQLFAALRYWELLISTAFNDLDESQQLDFSRLQVERLKSREVMLAFGGVKFSESVVQKNFKISKSWFTITLNQSGRFEARLLTLSP